MIDAALYARQLALPGFEPRAQQALADARVLVIGAGGLGSAVLPALAAAGVGTIGVVDDDVVERSNLHRQTVHTAADVGRRKVDSAAERLVALAPGAAVIPHAVRFEGDAALALARDYDLLVDGSDTFATRYLADDVASLTGMPLVWGAVLAYGGQAGVGRLAGGPGYRDLFPSPPPPETVVDCARGGVLPTVCGIVGSIMATEVLKILTGIGAPLTGRVTTYDALTGAFRELAYAADPAAEPVTGLIDYAAFCGVAGGDAGAGAEADPDADTDALTAPQLAARLAAPGAAGAVQLVDVRETWEFAIGSIPGARLMPLGGLASMLGELDADQPVVAYCHHGIRSLTALAVLRAAGFDAQHLEGGIDAWSVQVDTGVARY